MDSQSLPSNELDTEFHAPNSNFVADDENKYKSLPSIDIAFSHETIDMCFQKFNRDRLIGIKRTEDNLSYIQLKKDLKETYEIIDSIIKSFIDNIINHGTSDSWLAEDPDLANYYKKYKKNYKEKRAWKINCQNDDIATLIEMRVDGMDYGRLMQLRDNTCNGLYIDFFDKSLHVIRICHDKIIKGPEIAYHKGTNKLLSFAWQNENGETVGPAFFWDKNERLVDFKYHDTPVFIYRAWPPVISINNFN